MHFGSPMSFLFASCYKLPEFVKAVMSREKTFFIALLLH